MATTSNLKSAEVILGNGKFYPIHLQDKEIDQIISNVLELVGCYGRENTKAYFRKDKGGKGIDFRIDIFSLEKTTPELCRERRYSFGINANWDVVDFFDHWLFYTSNEEGQLEVCTSCEELLLRPNIGLKDILESRKAIGRTPVQNSYLKEEAWVCLTPTTITMA